MPVLCYTVWNLCTDSPLFPPGTESKTQRQSTPASGFWAIFSGLLKIFNARNCSLSWWTQPGHTQLRQIGSGKPVVAEVFMDLHAVHRSNYMRLYQTWNFGRICKNRTDVVLLLVKARSTPSAKSALKNDWCLFYFRCHSHFLLHIPLRFLPWMTPGDTNRRPASLT